MNRSTVISLAAVLFKSYFRASRFGRRSRLSDPAVLVSIDIALFVAPFGPLLYFLPQVPSELTSLVQTLAVQSLIVLPVILTSAVTLAGILFELGQGSGLASSEAVNWLPVSPGEYVVASSVSVLFTYSPLLFIGLGVTIPLALNIGMASVVPFFILISTVAYVWGAVIVEVLRSVMNRISTTLYKKSGRLGIILRIVLVVVLLVAVQTAFNPYILYTALSGIVNGVNLAWFVPVIWPSVAVVSFLTLDVTRATVFAMLSILFTLLIFEAATQLRARYWSPVPVTITVSTSTVYIPQGKSFLWLDPVAFAVASKELRSLARRKEMARFLAIPVLLVVSSLLPVLTSGADPRNALSGVSLVLLAETSLILPMMLSSISIGQEGSSIANIYMLPISADELVKGKLFLPWIISGAGILAVAFLMQFLAPVALGMFLATLFAAAFNMIIQGYVGLGTGSRHPSFNVGPRARYLTFTGFIIAFVIGGLATVATLTPLILYQATGFLAMLGGGPAASVLLTTILTAAVGTFLLVLTRYYCMQGVKKLLSSMEA
ncbi:MAG: hypothetical protein ABSB28_11685 [Candidatus Bathyarchaeia archaeon]